MADKDYISRLRETQLGEDLYTYLLNRQKLPKINAAGNMRNHIRGAWQPDQNQIWLQPWAGNSTLTHETAHAADTELERQYFDRKTSWSKPDVPTYFTDAFEKLKGATAANNFKSPREEMARRMAPEWFNKNAGYRATNNELAGWGAGRQAGDADSEYSPPNHLDSTMATELSILMELARRNDKPFPKQMGLFERLFKR
jgi:hypothetical protein